MADVSCCPLLFLNCHSFFLFNFNLFIYKNMVRTKEIQEWAKFFLKNQKRFFCFVVGPVVSFRSIKKKCYVHNIFTTFFTINLGY